MVTVEVEVSLDQIETVDLLNEIKNRGFTKSEITELLCESMSLTIIQADKLTEMIENL